MQKNIYTVAGHTFCIEHDIDRLEKLLPSYEPFRNMDEDPALLFTIVIDSTIKPSWRGEHVGFFPCNSAKFEVYKDGDSYQILIINEYNRACAFIQTADNNRTIKVALRELSDRISSFGLNNAIMLAYTICTSPHNTLLMHSSVIENNGKGYLFLGESGRGKSTHSDLWVKHIPGSTLINDDNPVLRIADDGTAIIYGSPWSGKRPIYKNLHYPIGGFAEIEQNIRNKITRQKTASAFSILLSSCSTMKFDRNIHLNICKTIGKVLETLPVHLLQCRPDKEAALVSSKTFGIQ